MTLGIFGGAIFFQGKGTAYLTGGGKRFLTF